jgi:hypothetical protein
LAFWFLGYPDQAVKKSHEALTIAQALSHPYSLAFALDLAERRSPAYAGNQKAKVKNQKIQILNPRAQIPTPKPKHVFSRPSRLPASSKPSR